MLNFFAHFFRSEATSNDKIVPAIKLSKKKDKKKPKKLEDLPREDIMVQPKDRTSHEKTSSHQNLVVKKPRVKDEKVRTVEDKDPFKVRVLIQKIISPDLIYVSLASNEYNYQETMQAMKEFYSSNQVSEKIELNLKTYYAVYSDKDKQYCRAQFLEMISPSHAKMLLIDLAEEQIVTIDLIQPLIYDFTKTPKHLFKVKIAGIRPVGGNKWLSSSIDKLHKIIEDPNNEDKFFIEHVVSCNI